MSTATRRRGGLARLLIGIVLAIVLLNLLVLSLDTRSIASALVNADLRMVLLAAVASLFAQFCWSVTTVAILGGVHESLPKRRTQLAYLAGTFGKQILPFGNVGGAAILTYVVAEDLNQRFREVFAAVTASELLIFAGSLGVATMGLVGLILQPLPGFDGPVVLAILVLVVVGFVAGGALVVYRQSAVGTLISLVARLIHLSVGRLSSRVAFHLEPDRVASGVDSFLESFNHATTDDRRLVVAATFGVLGWLSFSFALYLGFAAVGISLPAGLALFMAPASGLATLLPTPGGLGGTEVGLTAVFAVLTAASPEIAAAGVLLYRVVTYWLVVSIGGIASLYLSMTVWKALE